MSAISPDPISPDSVRPDPIRLDARVAVVTGSGRGLGRSYALALADAGAAVVVNDVDADAAEETADLVRTAGGRAATVVAAVGSAETADLLVSAAVGEFGRLDAMVTNAGVLRDRVLWKTSDDEFDLVVQTHLRGTFACARAAAVHFRAAGEGGRLILIGSPAGQFGSFGQTAYSAVKAGIVAMARTWSLELARAQVTANAVIPTAMTAMTGTMPIYAAAYESFLAGEALPQVIRREHALGSPDDVAPLIVWLASEASAGVTGQAIGLGGDRLTLYAHPAVLETRDADGGWTAAAIHELWTSELGASAQPSGPTFAPLD
ncbi:SDR family NAD(P)-dependent oxidoreductase [Naasia lichenicola]|uniref:SDR family oxidoreductase n=1 Tax=Naasia lichenicola TaxID=2565933 RepID=A0A4S4FJT7_9MICO|nr:SDR family NAD(P)-dependent oxidoreductase [Naasia lichenicola]THG29525.1 SDR family oxidoreductase [Naasia lichenicola]